MLQLRDILSQTNTTIAELVRQSGIPRRTIEEVLRRGDLSHLDRAAHLRHAWLHTG